ncbi:Uncharacterised protein [uncultured Ruminococcus sp.]|nr:Uncharacterised protein [uncultured Ruminococcus sp.]SCH41140.1 Uncharacterised protein [uncultured Clostridium sp.]
MILGFTQTKKEAEIFLCFFFTFFAWYGTALCFNSEQSR